MKKARQPILRNVEKEWAFYSVTDNEILFFSTNNINFISDIYKDSKLVKLGEV